MKCSANSHRGANQAIQTALDLIKRGVLRKETCKAIAYRKILEVIAAEGVSNPGQLAHNVLYLEQVEPVLDTEPNSEEIV
jgi:hypothetical protein